MAIFNKPKETMQRQDIEQLQIERLQSTLNRVRRNVAFYHNIFEERNIDITRVKSITDLSSLPFTTRQDLTRSYPYELFAVPLKDIVRMHSTSGTIGDPVIVGYTRNDLKNWTETTARSLYAADVTEDDVVQIAFHYNLFTGGFGFHQGAEKIGASVIPASSTTAAEKQIKIMKDFKTTVLVCTPSYGLNIAESLNELGMHPEELFLKAGLFGAEPWSNNLREELETSLGLSAFDTYGLSEIMGPGVAAECSMKNGLHVNEDHFILEVINPQTLEPVEPGTEGELVFTTITKEGFPLIRYRTGDISSVIPGPCSCGRNFLRINKVTGRTDDLIFIDEMKVFPSQIEHILLEVEGTEPHYNIILDREHGLDTMEIKVGISPDFPIDAVKDMQIMKKNIQERIEKKLGVKAQISLVEPKSVMHRDSGKVKRVIDRRDI